MQFVLTNGWEEGAGALAKRLLGELETGKGVLWLISGGSNIAPTVRIMDHIPEELSRNLTIMPADERYGPPGHAESNWSQLELANFQPKQAKLLPILKSGLDFDQNIFYYNELTGKALVDNQVVIAQLGIGPDGHIAGILPNSPACAEVTALAAGYEAPPLKRMTLTFPALRKITAAYALAYGENKRDALTKLQTQDLALSEQPAQILKELPEAYAYNDQLGESHVQ